MKLLLAFLFTLGGAQVFGSSLNKDIVFPLYDKKYLITNKKQHKAIREAVVINLIEKGYIHDSYGSCNGRGLHGHWSLVSNYMYFDESHLKLYLLEKEALLVVHSIHKTSVLQSDSGSELFPVFKIYLDESMENVTRVDVDEYEIKSKAVNMGSLVNPIIKPKVVGVITNTAPCYQL